MRLSVGGWEVGPGQGWEADVYLAVLLKDGGPEDIHPAFPSLSFPRWKGGPLPIPGDTDPARHAYVLKAGVASPCILPVLSPPRC